jgi:hypothetical protein
METITGNEPIKIANYETGLTIRHYFAIQIMRNIIGRNIALDREDDLANYAVRNADALIKRLNKE